MLKFNLGKTVMTRSISDALSENQQFLKEVKNALIRYVQCDWGEMCEEDRRANNMAVQDGGDRIFAAYKTCLGKIWIITEWDRSYTTILFPSDY